MKINNRKYFTTYTSVEPPKIDSDFFNNKKEDSYSFINYDIPKIEEESIEDSEITDLTIQIDENRTERARKISKKSLKQSADKTPNSEGKSNFLKYLSQAESEDPNVKKYHNWLIATAFKESTFRSNPKSPTGKHFGYFGISTDFINRYSGLSVEQFKNNPVAQIKTAAKLCDVLLNEGKNTGTYLLAKQKGYSDSAFLAGSWLGGVPNVKRYLSTGKNASDKLGDNIAKRMNDFNNIS